MLTFHPLFLFFSFHFFSFLFFSFLFFSFLFFSFPLNLDVVDVFADLLQTNRKTRQTAGFVMTTSPWLEEERLKTYGPATDRPEAYSVCISPFFSSSFSFY